MIKYYLLFDNEKISHINLFVFLYFLNPNLFIKIIYHDKFKKYMDINYWLLLHLH